MRVTPEQRGSFDRSLDILDIVSEYGPIAAVEMERKLGLPRSSLYRLLQGLRRRELVILDTNGMFRLGVAVIRMASNLYRQHPLPFVARQSLTALTEATGETSLLAVLEWPYAVCIDRVEPVRRMHISFDIGSRRPLYAGATAKVLLAFSGDAMIEEYLRTTQLTPITEHTTSDSAELRRQLAEVRERGYCYTEGELDPGAAAFAVPLLDENGVLFGGVSSVGPIGRLDSDSVQEHVFAAVEGIRQGISELRQ